MLFSFCPVWRLRNIQIGWSSSSPGVVAPLTNNYNVCATYPFFMTRSEYKEFECPAQSRYVIIQLLIKGYFTLCEVKVFGGMFIYSNICSYILWCVTLCLVTFNTRYTLDLSHCSHSCLAGQTKLFMCVGWCPGIGYCGVGTIILVWSYILESHK